MASAKRAATGLEHTPPPPRQGRQNPHREFGFCRPCRGGNTYVCVIRWRARNALRHRLPSGCPSGAKAFRRDAVRSTFRSKPRHYSSPTRSSWHSRRYTFPFHDRDV